MTKKNKNIIFVRTDDWEAVYIDGIQVEGKHRITKEDMLDILQIPYKQIDLTPEFDAKVQETGCLPDNIKDLNNLAYYKD